MHRLLRPKNINRAVVLLVLLAPILYLFGTQFTALAGAHGEELLAQSEVLRDEVTTNAVNDEEITFTNRSFGVSKIYGSSVVNGTSVDSSSISSLSYSSSDGSYLVNFPSITLNGVSNISDYVSSDGTVCYNTVRVNLGSMAWDKTSVFYLAPNKLSGRNIKANASFVSPYSVLFNGGRLIWNSGYLYFTYSQDSVFASMDSYDFREYMNGSYAVFTAVTPSYSQVDSLPLIGLSASSPVTINVPNSSSFDFTYWGSIYQVNEPYNDSLFGNMFGNSNFLSEWGADALSENRAGFAPIGQFFTYIDDYAFHVGGTQIGKMGYGYAYYAAHVLLFDLLVYFATFFFRIIKDVVDRLEVSK